MYYKKSMRYIAYHRTRKWSRW